MHNAVAVGYSVRRAAFVEFDTDWLVNSVNAASEFVVVVRPIVFAPFFDTRQIDLS